MNYSANQKEAIKQLLADVLAQTRPEEVFLVPNVFDEQSSVEGRTDGLGFGSHAEVVLMMYPIFSVLKELAGSASEGFAKKWGEHLAELIWSKKSDGKIDSLALASLRAAVVQRLSTEGVPDAESERVGDSVVSVLISRPELIRQIIERK
jgi:hypothetical protein